MTSRVLGLVRDQVLTHQFGAGDAMDAYLLAFRIPSLLRDLFAEGAMSAAFVPTFTQHLTTEGKPSAWRLGNNVINALVLVTGLISVLGIVFAEPLVSMFAGDYRDIPGKFELTFTLARIMAPVLTLVAVAAALMGMLNSLHHFFIPALAPAMFNVVTIVAAIAVVPAARALGIEPITLIAMSTLGGGIAQVALQWPPLAREGFRWRPVLRWRDVGLHRMLVLMGPGTIGVAATQVNVFVNTWLATSQGTGAVSWLTIAFRIMYLPIGLFGVSIATAMLPAVSRHSVGSDRDGVRNTMSDALSLMMMLNIPATVGLMVLASPIVQVLFERGRFTPDATAATASALQLYALGLVGYSITRMASPTFYALGRNRIPVLVSVASVLVNAVLNVLLVRVMGFRGLALGTSIAALFSAATLLVLLHRQLRGLNDRRLASSFARIVVAASVMGLVAALTARAGVSVLPGNTLTAQVARLTTAIGVSLLALAGAAWLLRIREFGDSVDLVLRRARRTR
jgi:putative peptidoglycan lipid II flippase